MIQFDGHVSTTRLWAEIPRAVGSGHEADSSTKQWLWFALNGVRQYESCTANAIEEALHDWFLKVLEKLRKRQNEVLFIVH